jgi:putative endonuclease
VRIVNPTAVLGENASCEYLEKKGYKILERNFRKGYGEIDIIALYQNTLVFIEVKTRSSLKYGTPFEAIPPTKLNLLIRGASFYKYVLHPELPDELRIDAIGVTVWGNEVINIEHLENISY